MAKALGIKQIEMYEHMIIEDFAPLITILESRTAGIQDSVTKQVKKDMGIYELLAEKAALKERIKEIESKTERLTKDTYHRDPDGNNTWISELSSETNRRLEELNEPLSTATEAKKEIVREIRLSSVPTDIKTIFARSGKIIKQLSKEVAKLPAINIGVVPELEDL